MFKALRKRFFPTEKEQEEFDNDLIILFISAFKELRPGLYTFLSLAAESPEEWIARYKNQAQVEGVEIKNLIYPDMDPSEVEVFEIFGETYMDSGLIGLVDWKDHYREIEKQVDIMAEIQGMPELDWPSINKGAENIDLFEYINLLSNSDIFSPLKFVYISFAADNFGFSLVPDVFTKHEKAKLSRGDSICVYFSG